jgi:hypothetical protein
MGKSDHSVRHARRLERCDLLIRQLHGDQQGHAPVDAIADMAEQHVRLDTAIEERKGTAQRHSDGSASGPDCNHGGNHYS